ncbi:hypothetical protein HF086_007816 [Spodoptera exigua]|uniref:Uncharacterized protein n=1 Tax=Spodoptera exigua TaxID=7107 RepID=A0A922SGR9_SPOEX|nr:hypothetical protein HF086_007816 [Spodoptera exigua]
MSAKMKLLYENQLLKMPPGTVQNIRKIHDLDKPERLDEAIKILDDWIQKQDHLVKKDFSNILGAISGSDKLFVIVLAFEMLAREMCSVYKCVLFPIACCLLEQDKCC